MAGDASGDDPARVLPQPPAELWIQLPRGKRPMPRATKRQNWGLRAQEVRHLPGIEGGQKRDGETVLKSPLGVGMVPARPSESLEAGGHTPRTCASTPSHGPRGV